MRALKNLFIIMRATRELFMHSELTGTKSLQTDLRLVNRLY